MRLHVKVLNGKECTIAATPSSTVLDVKIQVSTLLSVPVEDQKLLHQGRPLANEKKLGDYNISDGGKVVLVVRKSTTSTSQPPSPVWQKLRIFLQRHFTERDTEAVLEEFKKGFEHGLMRLSLDDIERLAASKLQQSNAV